MVKMHVKEFRRLLIEEMGGIRENTRKLGIVSMGMKLSKLYRILRGHAYLPVALKNKVKAEYGIEIWHTKEDGSDIECEIKLTHKEFQQFFFDKEWTYAQLAKKLKYNNITSAWQMINDSSKINPSFNERCKKYLGFIVVGNE